MIISKNILKIIQNRVLQHTLFWCVSYYVLLRLFASSNAIDKIDYIYTILFHLSIVAGVYVNLAILIPKLLSKKQYVAYALSLILLIVGASELNVLFFDKLVDYILPGYYFISYYEILDILKFVITYIAITSLLKLSKSWFELSDTNRRLNQLQKEKIETELKALKGQINPHFLFNSMNSIYSLALSHSEKTPEIILKLSDIMRYIIYEATVDFVDLSKEVKYLKDYIDLQTLRTNSRATIQFNITGQIDGILIAPLLFFPLVENSFKHGIKGVTGKSFININLTTALNKVEFVVENNKGITDNVEKKEYKGIGLDNVSKRLVMIYPGKHKMLVTDSDDTFKVELIINHASHEN